MEPEIIYHITTEAEWHSAQASGFYMAASLSSEGFIHCSTETQVEGVLDRYFNGQPGLVKLAIQVSKLVHPPKYEIASSISEAFPHVYGVINIDAVVAVSDVGDLP